MNYKKIVDITAAVNPPKYPCVFSSLSNNTVSTCNMTKFFFIVLTPAKFCASGLTSHSFLLSHDCLTKCIVLNVIKWTFFVPNFGVFLLQKQGFLYDVFEDSQYSTSWFQVRSSVNDFFFLVHDCKEKNMCLGYWSSYFCSLGKGKLLADILVKKSTNDVNLQYFNIITGFFFFSRFEVWCNEIMQHFSS